MTISIEARPGTIVTKSEASAQGLLFFFSGKPCRRGHIAKKYVSTSDCTECVKIRRKPSSEEERAARRARYAANVVENRAKAREWLAAHPGYNTARVAVWRMAHPGRANIINAAAIAKSPERYRVSRKASYERRKEKISDWHAANYAANRGKIAARNASYNSANPEVKRTISRNRKAKIRGAKGRHSSAEVRLLFKLQKGKCAYYKVCGNRIDPGKNGYHEDHIESISKGGSNRISNIQLTCGPCNLHKNAKDPLVFARQIGLLL